MIKIKWKYYWLIPFTEIWFANKKEINQFANKNWNLFFYQSEKIENYKELDLEEKKFNTWIIDLNQEINNIFKNFSQTIRNEIKKIWKILNQENLYWLKEKKYNLTIKKLEKSKKNLSNFISFYNNFAKIKKIPKLKYWILKKYLNNFNILKLTFDSDIIIYHIYLNDNQNKITRLMYSCSIPDNNNKKITWWLNNYFHYKDLEYYKNLWYKIYDFWGLFLDEPWNDKNLQQQVNITNYKLKFKPEIITQYHYFKKSKLYDFLKNIYLKTFK